MPDEGRLPDERLDTQQELKVRWALMAKTLGAARIVGKPDSLSRLGLFCASADGGRIFFSAMDNEGADRVFMLIEGGAAPRPIVRVSDFSSD